MVDRPRSTLALPWAPEPGDRLRFYLVLSLMLVLFVPPAVLIPLAYVPEPTRAELEEVPPQLATLLPEVEPMPVPEPLPDTPPEPETEAEPEVEPEPEPEPEATETPEPDPAPEPTPAETAEEAREVASRSGLLAMQDQLAEMRSLASRTAPARAETLSSEARSEAGSGAEREVSEEEVHASSGGVDDSGDPREEVQLAARETQDLEAAPEETATPESRTREAGPSERSMANIRATFDRNKTALFSLYNRALRSNPVLEGTVLLKLVIEPGGQVVSVEVVSSELNDEDLEDRLAARVQLFDFGSANVEQRTVEYPVNFLPPS